MTAIELAEGKPPLSDMPPMRAVLVIPKVVSPSFKKLNFSTSQNASPRLDAAFSKPFQEFVSLCLNKNPEDRPSAKELLRHKYQKNVSIALFFFILEYLNVSLPVVLREQNRFVKAAKKTSDLIDIVGKYEQWLAANRKKTDLDATDSFLDKTSDSLLDFESA